MKGSNAGESMFARVTTVDFNRSFIIISAGLTFDCSSTESNRCQVVTVPHFVSVTLKDQATISGASWNGETGGIIVFRSKNMVWKCTPLTTSCFSTYYVYGAVCVCVCVCVCLFVCLFVSLCVCACEVYL